MQPPPLNEKVLKDKRKKLKETLDRVLKMYVSIKTNVFEIKNISYLSISISFSISSKSK